MVYCLLASAAAILDMSLEGTLNEHSTLPAHKEHVTQLGENGSAVVTVHTLVHPDRLSSVTTHLPSAGAST